MITDMEIASHIRNAVENC